MKKVITKDCPSCDYLKIDDDSNLQCGWGKSESIKFLVEHKGRKLKTCNLKPKKSS